MPSSESVRCPLCHEDNAFLYTVKNGFRLYKSDGCGLIFIWPTPIEQIERLYRKDYFQGAEQGYGYVDYEKDKAPMEKTFTRYLTEIERYAPQRGRLLDVGTATGFFLQVAEKRGWQTHGIDISSYAVGAAQRNDLKVTVGTLENNQWTPEEFHLVTMWDVLEHVTSPERTFRSVGKVLKKGGIVALNTPDSAGIGARILGKKWYLIIPPEHTFLFNLRILTMLLEKNGFEVLCHTHIGKRYSLAYMFSILHGWQKLPWAGKIAHFLNQRTHWKITVPINIRDNIFVIARKR